MTLITSSVGMLNIHFSSLGKLWFIDVIDDSLGKNGENKKQGLNYIFFCNI